MLVGLVLVIAVCLKQFADRNAALAPHAAPDGRFWYDADVLRGILSAFSDEQRALYARSELTLDVVFPMAYGSLLAILAAWAFAEPRSQRVVLLPLVAAASDLVENVLNAWLASAYPDGPWALGTVAGAFTAIKWVAAGTSVLLVAGAGLRALARRVF